MPWKDDSQSEDSPQGPRGPWDAPGAAVAPPPERTPEAQPSRPWGDGHDAPARSSRLPPAAPAPRSPRGSRLKALGKRLRAARARHPIRSRGRGVGRAVAAGGALGLLCGWAASGFYRVGPDQVGVVERFGAMVAETGPGLHYRLPWPVGAVRRLRIGPAADAGGDNQGELDASVRMLAAGGEPLEVSYGVTWRVTDPRRYLFAVADAPGLLRGLAEGAVRRAVGAAAPQALLSGAHDTVEAEATASLRQALDRLGAGVGIEAVDLRGVDAADAAESSARQLALASRQASAAEAEAGAYRDRVTAQARGEAAKALQQAQGVADQEIAEARGEADRFAALDAAFRQAPQATRERLYDETMERVLKATNKLVVDVPKGTTVVLPASAMPARAADGAGGAAGPPADVVPVPTVTPPGGPS